MNILAMIHNQDDSSARARTRSLTNRSLGASNKRHRIRMEKLSYDCRTSLYLKQSDTLVEDRLVEIGVYIENGMTFVR